MSSTQQDDYDYSTVKGVFSAALTSKIMVAVVIILFLIFLVLFFSYLHAKHYRGANPTARRSFRVPIQFILAPEHGTPAPTRRGLDPAVITSLPVTVIVVKEGSDNGECAVCLCELSEGEEARILPGCSHGFHVECIDMWFHSNNTCPLCRAPVVVCCDDKSSESTTAVDVDVIPQAMEEAVRAEEESSSSAASKRPVGMLVIDIPRRDEVGLPLSRYAGEGAGSPLSSRLRSLRRILSSRGSMAGSPRGGDHIA